MVSTSNNGSGSRRVMFLTLFALAVAAVVSLVAVASWQNSVADSKRDDAKAYTARATLLQEGAAEGQQTADLLTTYVTQGDETLLPQIQEHTAAGVDKLTGALAVEGESDVTEIVTTASALVDGSTQVVVLRQGGDVAGAAAALQQLGPEFEQLMATQDAAIEAEQAAAASALSDADSAESLAAWLVVAAATTSIVATLGLLITLRRTVLRRRLPGTASSM